MSFTIKKFGQLIFVNKKWPNDRKIGCKSFPSLVDFIEIDVNLERCLKKLWKNEVMKL